MGRVSVGSTLAATTPNFPTPLVGCTTSGRDDGPERRGRPRGSAWLGRDQVWTRRNAHRPFWITLEPLGKPPWGYTHSIHLSPVPHTTKHNNTGHSHYVRHMFTLLHYVHFIDGKSALCLIVRGESGGKKFRSLLWKKKKHIGLKHCPPSLSFDGVTVKSSNWIKVGVEIKMQKECSFFS